MKTTNVDKKNKGEKDIAKSKLQGLSLRNKENDMRNIEHNVQPQFSG